MAKIIDIEGVLTAKEFATTKTKLSAFLLAIAEEMEFEAQDMDDASNPADFCDVVHSVAGKLGEASEAWNRLSVFIREHWTR